MPKMTPSKEKMGLAHKFAREMQKRFGADLKAVFVCGSVAANMATPESDIDIVVICKDEVLMEMKDEMSKIAIKTIKGDGVWILSSTYFEKNWGRYSGTLHHNLLNQGTVPILGREYCMEHRDSWMLPGRQTIEKKYFNPQARNVNPNRLKFKRRKTARVIAPHQRGK